MIAIGRQLPLDDLNLGAIGVQPEDGRLPLEDGLRVADGVWAVGDVAGPEMHTHLAHYEGELAAIRDTYQGGQENDRETLEIHERQVEAMRRRDMPALAAVLDEHFRMLEEDYAAALNRSWDDLFGEVAEQTVRLGSTAAA